jgi:RimJ/RimL family protein N-acetyltransferase
MAQVGEMSDWHLETERLYLRRVTIDDADLMLAIWNDPDFVRHVGDRGIRSIEQAREAVRSGPLQLYADYGYGPCVLVQKSDGARAGICGLFRREHLEHPDIGFALLPAYCGSGLASEAAAAVLAHARDDLDLEVITAIVAPQNAPSIALIRKLGLDFSGMITMPGDEEAICLYRKELGT